MATRISNVTNCAIFLAGTGSLLGRAEMVKLPEVTWKQVDHKTLGFVGTPQYPAGIEPMEMTIKWNSYYEDVLGRVANPFQTFDFQIRASLDEYDPAVGRIAQKPLVCYVKAAQKVLPLGEFQSHEKVGLETQYTVTYVKLEIDGQIITEIDVSANIYKVNGVDVLAQWRANLGI